MSTTNLNITELTVQMEAKEAAINAALAILDSAIGGKLTKPVAGSSNVTLTSSESQAPVLEFTGALTGSIFVDIPATGRNRTYTVFNNTTGAFTLTMRYNGAGTTVLIPQGHRKDIYHDGTNILELQTAEPCARVRNSADISCLNNTATILTFDTEEYDTNLIHDLSTNPGRLTCKTSGKYRVYGGARWVGNVTGTRQLSIKANGSIYLCLSEFPGAAAGPGHVVYTEVDLSAVTPDYLELEAFQTSGGALSISSLGRYSPVFGMSRMG